MYLLTSFVPSSTTENGVKYLVAQLESIRSKQFDLVYYGKFSYSDTSSMTLNELDWFYKRLLDTKKEEKEIHDKALQEASQSSKARKVLNNLRATPKTRRRR